ncbi:BUD7_3 [Blepharisma stoltei]|uniref:Uncharacterized protein n=1 Tax=Blepharisma stoltei TaxID=1481888 RepID=A0AAU9K2E2_9CILI|nr:unnamed protein product [Blepharisma stoltei]
MDSPINLVEFEESHGIGFFLDYRTSQLGNFQGLGEPDLCYFVCEATRSGVFKYLKKSSLKAYYHFVYGVNTSSITFIQNYIKSFTKSLKNSKVKINATYFCIYDFFSKFDLRIEINNEASVDYYLVNSQSQRIQAGNIHWQGAYISSMLRFLYADPIPGSRLLDGPTSIAEIENFIETSSQFWDRIGFVLGDINDIYRYGENLLFAKLSDYWLKYKRYNQHSLIFKNLITIDPMMVFYLCKSYIKLKKFEEIIEITSCQINTTPFAFPLYFLKAYALYRLKEYKEARIILQYLIELNLEVFCFWELMAKCYLKEKKYEAVFLCLNCFPIYESLKKNNYENPPEEQMYIPKKIPVSCSWNIWKKPSKFDFKSYQKNAFWTRNEEISLDWLKSLKSSRLNNCERKMYKILVQLEKHVEWENLLKLKKRLFTQNNSTTHERDSFTTVDQNSQELIRRNISLTTINFETAPKESEMPTEGLYGQNFHGSAITPRDYFILPPTDNRLTRLMHPSMRVMNKKLSELFNYMHYDLKALYEWQKQAAESDSLQNLNKPTTLTDKGEIWLRRGALAERLRRSRLAEKAYRHSVNAGFSLYGLYRLMKLYVKAGNPKSAVLCIIDTLAQIEQEKFIFDTEVLPPWIGMVLAKICSTCGYKQLYSLAIEADGKKFPILIRTIEGLKKWNTDGSHRI